MLLGEVADARQAGSDGGAERKASDGPEPQAIKGKRSRLRRGKSMRREQETDTIPIVVYRSAVIKQARAQSRYPFSRGSDCTGKYSAGLPSRSEERAWDC